MDSPPSAALTRRQCQVLQMIACGQSNAHIGRALYLTENTVKGHMRRICARLGARDRAHAVALACRDGLVDVQRVTAAPGPRRVQARPDLRDARLEAGLSQRQLALQLGVPQPLVSYWETGARQISTADARRFMEAVKTRE